MEVFIIIVAIVAIVAALLLLLLLQLKIKKQAAENPVVPSPCEARCEEIATLDRNDPYFKSGPPPYREVMKSPERYPLSSSSNLAFGEPKIKFSSSHIASERSKRTWDQFMTAVLRPDDLVPSMLARKPTSARDTNHISQSPQTISQGSTSDIHSCHVVVDETADIDEELPTYHQVCSGGVTAEHTEGGQRNCSTSSGDCELGQSPASVRREQAGRTIPCDQRSAFTVSNTLSSMLVQARVARSSSLPIL